MAKERVYKIAFDGEGLLFRDEGKQYEKGPNNTMKEVLRLPEPFEIKSGQTLEITEEAYKYLSEKGAIKSKKEKKAIEDLRKEYLAKGTHRAEPKEDVATLLDSEKDMLFNEYPYEV